MSGLGKECRFFPSPVLASKRFMQFLVKIIKGYKWRGFPAPGRAKENTYKDAPAVRGKKPVGFQGKIILFKRTG